MERGDVHKILVTFEDPAVGKHTDLKYVVLLRGGADAAREAHVPFVIASTVDNPNRAGRPIEVFVGEAEGFDHLTAIDCRWVSTLPKMRFNPSTKQAFSMQPSTMKRVSIALLRGLQFGPAT